QNGVDLSLVDVPYNAPLIGPLHEQLDELTILQDGNPRFLGFRVDDDGLLHRKRILMGPSLRGPAAATIRNRAPQRRAGRAKIADQGCRGHFDALEAAARLRGSSPEE